MKTLEKLKDKEIKKAEKLMERGGVLSRVITDPPDHCDKHIADDHECEPPE